MRERIGMICVICLFAACIVEGCQKESADRADQGKAATADCSEPYQPSEDVLALIEAIRDTTVRSQDRYNSAQSLVGCAEGNMALILPLLAEPDETTQYCAIIALRGCGAEAVDILLALLEDSDDYSTRTCAAGSLGAIGDPRAVPALRQAYEENREYSLHIGNGTGRYTGGVLEALADIGDPGTVDLFVSVIRQAIEDPRKSGRWRIAIDGLTNLDAAQAIDLLVETWQEHHLAPYRSGRGGGAHSLSRHAMDRIRKMQAPGALNRLCELAIGDPQSPLTRNAIYALANYQFPKAAEAFIQAYRLNPESYVLASIGRTKQEIAVPFLISMVLDPETQEDVRLLASGALAMIGSVATPGLLEAWEVVRADGTDWQTRQAVIWAMGGIADERMVPAILEAWAIVKAEADYTDVVARRTGWEQRRAVIRAMQGIADERMLPAWREVYDMYAPTARAARWGTRYVPEWEMVLECFHRGMAKIGPPAIPFLRELHAREPHERLRARLHGRIEAIRGQGNDLPSD